MAKTAIRGRSGALGLGSLLFLVAYPAAAQPVSPGTLRTYSTPQSIGVEWDVSGDGDHDATVAVRYRVVGSATWSPAYPLFRVDFSGANMLAGSVLFLDGGRDYELELDLTDPDGGGETRVVTVTTGPVPVLPSGGNTFHVVPGSGGGDGSESDPFQGIAAADAVAAPGDTLLVHAGDYGGQRAFFDSSGAPGNYVAWVAADDQPPRIDDLRIRGDYIWLEGFDISAPDNAVRNEGPSTGAVLKGNRITGCHYCIHLNSGADGWWISDNVIVGDADPASGSFSGEGIELSNTPNHTIAHNSISRVADGVSYPERNVDIFGNDIFETSDDGVEADNGFANVRIWGNRIHHAHNNGITFQPMNGAPWYVVRNQVIGSGESVLKLRTADRALIAHNTFVGWARVLQNSVGLLRNMTLRNNIWVTMTGDYLWEDTGNPNVPDSYRTSLDYDGFAWPDTTTLPLFKWKNVRYDDLAQFQAGESVEPNAIRVPLSCFETLDVPGPAPAVIPPQRVSLAAGCNAIDAGEVLPNINDDFVGMGPDLGAHERDAAPQQYGPRNGAGGAGGTPGAGGMPGVGGMGGTVPGAGGSATGGSAGTGTAGSPMGGGGPGAGGGQSAGGTAGTGANSATGSGDSGGCGCAVPGRSPARSSWLLLLGLAALARRKREPVSR